MGRMIPMTPSNYSSLITSGRLLDNMTSFQPSRVRHAGGPVRWASVRTGVNDVGSSSLLVTLFGGGGSPSSGEAIRMGDWIKIDHF
jgi:hypothetical protein